MLVLGANVHAGSQHQQLWGPILTLIVFTQWFRRGFVPSKFNSAWDFRAQVAGLACFNYWIIPHISIRRDRLVCYVDWRVWIFCWLLFPNNDELRAKLEETVSLELLRKLTCMPMEAFEFHIWKEFGMKNIKPSDRRKVLIFAFCACTNFDHIQYGTYKPEINFTLHVSWWCTYYFSFLRCLLCEVELKFIKVTSRN